MYELGVVYRSIRRADSDLAARLGTFGTATVHEAMGRTGLLKPYMSSIPRAFPTAPTPITRRQARRSALRRSWPR